MGSSRLPHTFFVFIIMSEQTSKPDLKEELDKVMDFKTKSDLDERPTPRWPDLPTPPDTLPKNIKK